MIINRLVLIFFVPVVSLARVTGGEEASVQAWKAPAGETTPSETFIKKKKKKKKALLAEVERTHQQLDEMRRAYQKNAAF